jgi:hypothetical protein
MSFDLKRCTKCGEWKSIDNFFFKNKKKGQYQSMCKPCFSAYKKEYYVKNREIILDGKRVYYLDNKEDIIQNSKLHYQEHKEIKKQYNANYYVENKAEMNESAQIRRKNRKKKDPAYKLREEISTIIRRILKRNNGSKYGNSISDYLPYTIQELKNHIESQFESWMNWNNQGKYQKNIWDDNNSDTWTWQIDHIIPQSELPYSSMEDENFQKCWALNNLRPLNAKQNHIDGVNRIRHKGQNVI